MDEKNLFKDEYLQRIQTTLNLSDFVYDAIKDSIVSGRLTPGSKLKQLDLAKQLDVSQQTIREALKRLVNSGLVVQKPNRGFAVTEIPIEEQDEIYEIRAVLEALAIEKAVDKVTDEDLVRMRELLPLTASPDGKLPIDRIREANREFHMIPVRATNNRHLIRLIEQLLDIIWTYLDEEINILTASDDLEEHTEILHALENRDPKKAREAMIGHIQNTNKTLIKMAGRN